MSDLSKPITKLPPEQEAIRAKCFHPTGTFIEFGKEDVEGSIPQRFEKIVRLHPDRLALKMDERALTYEELNKLANQIARVILARRGQGSEPIALLFEHGIEVVAAMIGVLKAGKFYVALDIDSPRERVMRVLRDSGVHLIVTNSQGRTLTQSISRGGVELLTIDEIDGSVRDSENLGVAIASSDVSGIVYTSGTTGEPKGAIETHGYRLHVARGHTNLVHVCPEDRLSLVHSISFGSGLVQVSRSLLNGASLFPFDLKSRGMDQFTRWLDHEQISIGHLPTSAIRQLGDSPESEARLKNLRLVHLSGSPITKSDFELYKRHFPESTFLAIHMGATGGGTICSCILDKTFTFPAEGTPLGFPVEGIEIFLIDEHRKEVGLSRDGEIAVRSRFLGSGYWGEPELSKARFVGERAGNKEPIYLTGDMGRRLPDGFLIHLGRKDLMVKIRGFRVELGEIESTLLKHPKVSAAGVRAWDHASGEKYLAAYVVPRANTTPTVDELREFLKQIVRDYMIPSAFVFMDDLPLTNGKLDRTALPKPGSERPKIKSPYVFARGEVEQTLVQIWEQVLDVRPVGIHDNFFDLGGHSLLAMRIASRVAHDFQVDLPVNLFFEFSTIASHADYIEGARHAGTKTTISSIPVISRQGQLPLSFGQERLWFLNQLELESPLYNEPKALRLIGVLNVKALENTFNAIIARHEVLRTTIVLVEGHPIQRIANRRTIELPVIDLRTHIAQERDAEARRLINETICRPFDLSSDLMLRALLLRLDDQEHILLVVKHHAASDGWSSGVFWREVATLYAAFSSGQPANLPELPVQYADYAAWQREWLQGELLENQLSYWRKQLDNLATLQLPTDRPRPAIQSFHGARQTLVLSNDLSQALRTLSRKEGASLFMTLLAAFQILLYRYTGQDDIAVGSAVAGRNRGEIEGLIGFFVNTLVLRTNVSGNPTFKELLERVEGVCLGAYSHQDLPFEKLVAEVQPERSLNRNPLFQVMFQLSNGPRTVPDLSAIKVDDLDLDGSVSKFDLSLSMADNGEEITGRLQYNTDLFNVETIERMLGHFQNLLEGIVADPEQRISELPLLTESEKHQLSVQWNDTQRNYSSDKCIHQLFEEQVERTPEAVAVVFEDQRLTYRELNNRANQLAHYLRKLGVRPEVLVGICVERSIEMVVGLLGILKAGAAYVPLDPTYPKERLGFMLDDSQVVVLLTQQQLLDRLPDHKVQIVCMDKDREQLAQESNLNPITEVTCQKLAYVIYTSGTSGTPKGVMIDHRSLVNYICWFNESPLAKTVQSLPVITRPIFDASLKQLFAPLLRAGQVWILSDEVVTQPAALLEALTTRTMVGLNCVPSFWRAVLDDLNPGRATAVTNSLSSLLLGGERLDQHLIDRTFAAMPDIEIWNLYGPTEATANACTGIIMPHCALTIGRPIANTQLYILDGNLQPVPIGVPGELHIGGDGLGRGYLNRPELTREKFIANPFSADPTSRLYKTGDVGRYLPDGNIEFLGRIDNQVKIRGYRIELGEIEAVLSRFPAVREAVVLAREDSPGDRRLIAYVVAVSGSAPSANELRSFVQQKLPEYMIPSVFLFLDALPLTPNGKIDRKSLPARNHSRPELEKTYTAPRTPTEGILARIWAEVLKVEKVGIHDNFFNLGGHSLLATQVMSRIRDGFQISIPLRALFEKPTVEEFAIAMMHFNGERIARQELSKILDDLESLSDDEVKQILV